MSGFELYPVSVSGIALNPVSVSGIALRRLAERALLQVALRGMPVTLLDTAGMRETDDAVEKLGVRRSAAAAAAADITIFVYDAAVRASPSFSVTPLLPLTSQSLSMLRLALFLCGADAAAAITILAGL